MDLKHTSTPDSSEQDPYSDDGEYGSDEDYQPASEELATSDEENSRGKSREEETSGNHFDKFFSIHEAPDNSKNQSCISEGSSNHQVMSDEDANTHDSDSNITAICNSDKRNTTEPLPRIVSITGNVLTQKKGQSSSNSKILPSQRDSDEENSIFDSSNTDADDILREIIKILRKRKKHSLKSLLKLLKYKKLKCQKCSFNFMDETDLTSREQQVNEVNNDIKVESFDDNSEETNALMDTTQDLLVPRLHRRTSQLIPVNSNENSDLNDDQFDVNSDMNHEDTDRHSSRSNNDVHLQIAPKNKTTVQRRSDKTKKKNTESYSQHKIHKCKECDICFLSSGSLKSHKLLGKHDLKTKTQCPECDLFFTGISLKKHIQLHHNKTENTISDSNIPSTECSKTIYKCRKCDLYFLTSVAINSHLHKDRHRDQIDVAKCSKCKLFFSKTSMPKHLKLHHEILKLNTENDFHIKVPNSSDAVMPKLCSNTIYKCRICEVCFISPKSIAKHVSVNKHKEIPETARCSICDMLFSKISMLKHLKYHHGTLKLKTENDFRVKIVPNHTEEGMPDECSNKIYKCRKCEVCFITQRSIEKHVGVNKHRIIKKQGVARCSICNLLYSKTSMTKHLQVHHKTLNLKTENDFLVMIVPFKMEEASKEVLARRYSKTIYKCKKCDIYFLMRATIQKHICSGHKKGLATRCSKCNLLFYNASLQNHLKFHHGILKLDIESDFDVKIWQTKTNEEIAERYSKIVYKCRKCEVCFLTLRSIGKHVNVKLHKIIADTARCSICNLLFSKLSMSKHLQVHHGTLNLKTESDFEVEILPPSLDKTINAKNYSKTVYKCKVCEVCFLTHKALENHVYGRRHETMTNVASCSVCNLLFSNKALRKHLKFHHETLELKTANDFHVKILPLKSLSDESIAKRYDKTIYKCRICEVNFLTLKSMQYHQYKERLNETRIDVATCSICELVFSKQSMPRHLKFHHKSLKLRTKNDFNVKTMPEEDNSSLLDNRISSNPNTSSNQHLNITKDFQLKECVVILTDILQSAFVSTTSNGTLEQCTRQLSDFEHNVINFTKDASDTHSDTELGCNVTEVSHALHTRNSTIHDAPTLNTYSQSEFNNESENTIVKSDANKNEILNVNVDCVKTEVQEFDDIKINSTGT